MEQGKPELFHISQPRTKIFDVEWFYAQCLNHTVLNELHCSRGLLTVVS